MKTLASFENLHQGATIVVCGCGESLNELTCPERFVTIGVNDVGRKFQPDYLVVVNPPSQFSGDRFNYVKQSQAKFLFTQLDLGVPHPNIVKFQFGVYGGTDFSNPNVLHYTQNSPYVALCLAAHMGAKRIGLIGVDFTDNHFFARTGTHALSLQFELIDGQYRRLCEALRARGVEVFNLSRTSRLTAFQKISLEEFASPDQKPAETVAEVTPLKFVSYATTPVAGVPAILARCINARTPHTARSVWARHGYGNGVTFKGDIAWTEKPGEAEATLAEADVVIVHNGKVEPRHQSWLAGKAVITMAHNYLWNVDQSFVQKGFPGVVVGQYQATLPEFAGWQVVPNPIPLWEEEYSPGTKHAEVTICYTPSGKHERYPPGDKLYWHAKGYDTTMRALERLSARLPLRLEVIRGAQVSHAESLMMKRRAHIVIDECVTGSYHRNSLEGLAAGCVVVNGVGLLPEVLSALSHCAGQSSSLPFTFASLDNLEEVLATLIGRGAASLLKEGRSNRLWLEQNWEFGKQWELFWQPVVRQALRRAERTDSLATNLKQVVKTSTTGNVVNGGLSMSEGKEGVSVIIPHGGEERLPYLKATLANLRQCRGVSEIIVLEMSTTPFAIDVARRWADKYVFARHQGSFERARALNMGSSFAEYDLVLWLDNDLIVPLDFISRAAAEFRAGQLDYLVPYSRIGYLSSVDSQAVMRGARNPADCQPVNVLRSQDASGGAGLVGRKFLLRYGGLPEGFRGWGGEDNSWIHKASLLGRVARTRFQDQMLYHLFHACSGGYGGASHRSHPYYAANLALMNELRTIRDPHELLRRFPSPSHFPCPWDQEKRIVFIADETQPARAKLARQAAKHLQQLFALPDDNAQVESDASALIEQWPTKPPDAVVIFGAKPALRLLARSAPSPLSDRVLIIADEQTRLTETKKQKLGRFAATLATTTTAANELKQSGLRPWEWYGQTENEPDARQFALALAQPLSVILGQTEARKPAPQEERKAEEKVVVRQNRQADLPVWLYWEGECPEWIKACQQTIFAHARGARLLTPEEFNRLRDTDRDIDLSKLHVAHRADFIRAFLLARYGGLWVDSDCLVMRELQPLIAKLGEYDFLAHRERSGYVSNGFIGAPPGSRTASDLYRRLCSLIRSGQTLGWISLGGQPLTEIINNSVTPWLELACEVIQPVCWSQPEVFFALGTDAEHERAFNEQAICYMLSNNSLQKHQAAHPAGDLLAEGTFFRYLWQRSLGEKARQAVAPQPSNGAEMNGTHRWRHLPFCLEAISQVSPARVLDLDVGLGRWGLLLRDLYEKKNDRRHWQIRLEGVADSAETLLEHHRFFYDQIHVGEAATVMEESSQTWDLTIFGSALKKSSQATAVKALHKALRKSSYVLISMSRGNGSEKGSHVTGASARADSSLSLRRFLASRSARLEVRHECDDHGEETYLLSQTDPKRLKHDSGLESLFTGIYHNNLRLGDESVSGPGSCLAQTAEIRQRLPLLVSAFDIKSMLDAPCGDFLWLRDVNLRLEEYIGADIVPQLVAQNQARHGTPGRRFVMLDITADLLPQVDLIFCRDCLVHFSYAEIDRALRNFKASGSKYLLLTTFTKNRTNFDIANGDWRPLNFQLPPFNFPAPLCLITEKCTEGGGIYSDKSLGLWPLSDLPG